MKSKPWIYKTRKHAPGGTTLFCVLAVARAMQAQQQVLAPPPENSATPPAVQEYETNQVGAPLAEPIAAGVGTEPHWLQWGPLTLHPHPLFRFLYGSGVQSAPGQSQNTAIEQFAPGVLFNIGSHWTLDYTPLFSWYSSSNFQNTIDENVMLNWGTTYQDWTLGFSQSYVANNAPLIQTGMQTKTEDYVTSAKATYQFSSRMSVDLSIVQNFSFAEGFTSTRSWSTTDWLNYDTGERWDVGVGLGYEYDDVNPGPNAMDELVQGRVRWRTTDKISFALHGGVEVQQYLESGVGSLVTPVFGMSVQYKPVKTTTLSLTADRTIAPSLFQGQVTESTSVGISLNQQLLTRFHLTAGAVYGTTSYLGTTIIPTAGTGRSDNYYSLNVRLGTAWLDHGTAAVFYQYSYNPSTEPGFSFSSSQVGAEIGYRF